MTHSDVEQRDVIDLYLLGRLAPELQAEFEEHFLTCRDCVETLETNRECIAVVREAFAQEEQRRSMTGWRFLIPLPAWGLAVALCALAVYVTIVRRSAPAPARVAAPPVAQIPSSSPLPVIELQSYRAAAGEAKITAAAAARPFLLRLDLRAISSYQKYLLRIVSDSGELLWSAEGIPPQRGDWLEVKVEGAALAAGGLWVRLFGVRPDGQADFLREYSLVVAP